MTTHSALFSALVTRKEVTIRMDNSAEIPYLRTALNRERTKYNELAEPILGIEACVFEAICFKFNTDLNTVTIKLTPKIKKSWEIIHAQEN